jgi:hypothetical protein
MEEKSVEYCSFISCATTFSKKIFGHVDILPVSLKFLNDVSCQKMI